MQKIASTTKFHAISLFIIVLIFFVTVFTTKNLNLFGNPILLASTMLIESLLIFLFLYESVLTFRSPLKTLWLFIISIWQNITNSKYFLKSQKKYPTLFKYISNRFSFKKPTGLLLTIGTITAIFFLSLFLEILWNVLFKGAFINIDHRVLNLIPNIRSNGQTVFFRFITFMGNWQSVVFTSLLIIIFLLRKKRNFINILFVIILITAEGIAFILKHLVGRIRPDQILSLVTEKSFSFPSGHAIVSTVIFGFLSYLIIKSFKNSYVKILIFFGGVFFVFLIALSRIYLGVHYPSDVLASITLGCVLLSIFITIVEINERYSIFHKTKLVKMKELLWVPLLLIIFSLFLNIHFIKIKKVQAANIQVHSVILSGYKAKK